MAGSRIPDSWFEESNRLLEEQTQRLLRFIIGELSVQNQTHGPLSLIEDDTSSSTPLLEAVDHSLTRDRTKSKEIPLKDVNAKLSIDVLTTKDSNQFLTSTTRTARVSGSCSDLQTGAKSLEERLRKGELELKLKKAERDLKLARYELAVLRNDSYNLKVQNAAELEQLKAQHQKEIKQIRDNFVADKEELRAQCLAKVKEMLQKRLATQSVKQQAELKEQRRAAEPLLVVGAAIRSRYIEQTIGTLRNNPRQSLDQATIRRGNTAAHGANGDADFALLKSGLASDPADLRDKLTTIYSLEYETWPEITRKARDCDIVISTVQILNDGSDSREERKEHAKLMKKIYAANCSRKSDVEFDGSVRHKAWLARLQELTAEIVELDRDRS